MRRHVAVIAGVAVLFGAAALGAGQGTPDDEKALDAYLAAWDAAFNAHDAKAVAALYTEDAETVLPDGRRLKGRAGIEKDLAESFAKNPNVQTKNTLISRRFLKPDVVLEDGRWEDTGHADTDELTRGLFTTILVKQRGK
jgi:uncharacterized protein (TIGR02246 family)